MHRFEECDQVRVDIPDTTDPDYDRWHGVVGTIVDIRQDNGGDETGEERDNIECRIEQDDG